MKICCFRFDADTHLCVARGIPALVALGDELGVKFTFFVNMGRAFDRLITLRKMVHRLRRREARPALSAGAKLRWRASAEAAILNPRAGACHGALLRSAARSGHEIGLHGGRNHATWERSAHTWSEAKVEDEVRTGARWLAEAGIEGVRSFASPAWNSPPSLRKVLPRCGFDVLADLHDARADAVLASGGLIEVPTNITIPEGSAGYLEFMRLSGRNAAQMADDFRRQLAAHRQLAVVYDHPFFAGLHALEEVRTLVQIALEEGWSIRTIREAATSRETPKTARAIA